MTMKKLSTFTMVILLCIMIAYPAFAAEWVKSDCGGKTIILFTYSEQGLVFPFPISVGGYWEEHWNGTQGGYAQLTRLYHAAIIFTNVNSLPFTIDDLVPSATYKDGTRNDSWHIVYPYSWVLTSPDWTDVQGYNNPGTSYNNPNVTGNVFVYAPDTNQIYGSVNWHWVQ